MTLSIDTARALRSHHSRVELVAAIVAAPANTQETPALEWKSQIDLSDRGWRFRLAKGVLGFANRDPVVAVRWFQGCAYFVAGASPGSLTGTRVVDAASLGDMLAPYLGKGPSSPEWSPDYVELDGKQVLVLTIEPPRAGRPIWTLLKEYAPVDGEAPFRAGTIFVRHKASTDAASPADVTMLTRRAVEAGSRLGGLSLVIRPNVTALPIDVSPAGIQPWLDAEREELKPRPEPPRPKPRVVEVSLDKANKKGLTAADLFASLDRAAITSAFGSGLLTPDPRSRDDYQAEVEAYLWKVGERLPGVIMRAAIRREWGRIDLALRNDTPDNYHKVEVELYIAIPGVKAFFYSGEVPGYRLPARPIAFGKAGRNAFDFSSSIRLPRYDSYLPSVMPNIGLNRGTIDNSSSSRITLAHVDARPKRLVELDSFYLIVPAELAGTSVTASWTATATDASGDMEGTIDIPVLERMPTLGELMTDVEDDDGHRDYGSDEE